MDKVLIIGLDGVNWDILNVLFKHGCMPNLEQFSKDNIKADFKSTIPPITPTAWASFQTGKKPFKHQIFDFYMPGDSLSKIVNITASHIGGETFLEILEQYDKKLALVNLPISYPPRTNGPLITCMATPSKDIFYPKNITNKIMSLKDYRIFPNAELLNRGDREIYIKDILDLERKRFKTTIELSQKTDWDLFFVLFSGTDWIMHELYAQIVEERDVRGVRESLDFFRELDKFIAYLLEKKSSNTYTFIISDHGFKRYEGTFRINEWLINQKLLKVERSVELTGGNGSKSFKPPQFVFNFAKSMRKAIPYVQKLVPQKKEIKLVPIPSKTIAYSTTASSSSIYINCINRFVDGIVSNDEYSDICKSILDNLSQVKDNNGEQIIPDIKHIHDYTDETERYAGPDIFLFPGKYWIGGRGAVTDIFETKLLNHHNDKGIFIAEKNKIQQNTLNEVPSIEDIAPTVLSLFGLPVPEDMDGKAINEALAENQPIIETMEQKIKRRTNKIKKGLVHENKSS